MRWALILLGALVLGLVVGALTFAQMTSWPATMLAALTTMAASIPGLHQVLA